MTKIVIPESTEGARLRAENARLREALEWAVDAWDTHCQSGDHMQGYWVRDARAALSGPAPGEGE